MIRICTFSLPLFRKFSFRKFSSFKKLTRSIEKEIEYEQNVYKINEAISRFLLESGFELKDDPNSSKILLQRISHEKDVIVVFDARVVPKPDEGYLAYQKELEEKGDALVPHAQDFKVIIKKRDGNNALVYDCSTFDDELHIIRVYYTEDTELIKNPLRIINRYQGRYLDLIKDKDLPLVITDYLKDHGITKELIKFVQAYSTDKERAQYLQFLTKLKDFVH